MPQRPAGRLDRSAYRLEIDEAFDGPTLNRELWLPCYLPQWSSRAASAARYELGGGTLRLRIDADQQPWRPEWDGQLRVSSLQTGVFAGPLGSRIGQHRFRADLVVREEQATAALYTPTYGLFECRARAIADPANMVALWMIGFEDQPEHSAEILLFEIFGRDVSADRAAVGMGLRPFADPAISGDVEQVALAGDATAFHEYAAEWTLDGVRFYIDGRLVKTSAVAPHYPMQVMLNVYEFADGGVQPSPPSAYPKRFEVDWFRGWRRAGER